MGFLPTKRTQIANQLNQHSMLIHGPPKLGKTAFLASVPDCVILATEPGYKSQSAFVTQIYSWPEALQFLSELEGKHQFKNVGIDTVDNLFHMCAQEICDSNDKQHYTDIPWGKGKDLMINEFRRFIFRLMSLPMGVILISHSMDVTIKARTGEYDKTVPALHKFVRDIILGEVDIILFGEMISKRDAETKEKTIKRVLRSKVHTDYEAGDRTDRLDPVIELFKDGGYAHMENIYNDNRDAESATKKENSPPSKKKASSEKTENVQDKTEAVNPPEDNKEKKAPATKSWKK